ncbi:biofilm exopolysaccharide biosynthesis protein EpsG [Intestinibacter bartlettii]|uniref:EpsG family protein n=1 Tax=Intestinibacter bartlettii TaxID=261299 RepID=UPI0034B68426
MNVYIFLIIWVIFFGILSNMAAKSVCVGEDKYEYRTNMFMAILTFLFLIVLAGLRSGMADTPVYIQTFKSLPTNITDMYRVVSEYEKSNGFYFFAGLIKCFISDDYHVWLFIVATINGICVAFTLKKYSSNFAISALLFILTCYYTWMFNGLKQFFAATVMFAATGLILKKKIIPYIILVLFMSTFHNSVLIFIPVYFIVQGEAWNKRTIVFILLTIMAMIFANQFTNIFNDVVENTTYSESMQEIGKTDDGTNIIRILVESIPMIISFIYRKRIKEISTPIIDLCINMSIMGTGIYIISKILSSGVMIGRLPIYFTMYNLILLPWLIHNLFDKNERRLMYYLMIVCYFAFFYYQIFINWGGFDYMSNILHF